MKGMSVVLDVKAAWALWLLCRRERMVDQDPPVVIDDKKLEPACEHSLTLGEQHLPAEGHNVALLAGAWRSAKANALLPCVPGDSKDKLTERAISPSLARSLVGQGVRRPERGDGARALDSIWFVPRGDIAIGERLSVEHRVSQSDFIKRQNAFGFAPIL